MSPARRDVKPVAGFCRRRAFWVLCMAAASFLSGCGGASVPASRSKLIPPVPVARARSAIAPASPPPASFTLAWECYSNALDGSVTTGVQTSPDLILWQLAEEWPLLTVSNTWTALNTNPAQFYRVFTRWTVEPVVVFR